MVSFREDITIPEYYAGQSIFITGGTGLVGKALVEKILRSCPDVVNVYVLIRPKKSMSIEERWSKITKLPLFDKLNTERPEAFRKVSLIQGDICEPDLALTENDKRILVEKTTLVYHGAAMIQFTDSVKDALQLNLEGTLRVLRIGKLMKNLKAFVFISTAFVNEDKPSAEGREEIQPACQDWKVIMKILKNYPLQLQSLKEKLLGGHSNPYTWSKLLAENAVHSHRQHFPIIIIRPAIVTVTMEDPMPGWKDNWNGYTQAGLMIILGLIQVLPMSADHCTDVIPLDYATKTLLIAPWKLHSKAKFEEGREENAIEVYNCCLGNCINLSEKDMVMGGLKHLEKYPSKYSMWVCNLAYVPNRTLFNILIFFYQVVPSALVDFFLVIFGKRAKALKLTIRTINLLRLTKNITEFNTVFPNEKCLDLWLSVKDVDKADFYCTPKLESNDELLNKVFYGLRKYILKEDFSEEALRKNKIRMNGIKLLHKTSKFLLYLMLSYWFFSICGFLKLHL